jgi:hypothetical protein
MYWPYWCRLSALSWYLSAGLTTGARRGPGAGNDQQISCHTYGFREKAAIDVRGRAAWRMLGVSVPAVVALATCCRGVEEKARQLRDDRAADARERPEPSRIRERGAAIVIAAIPAQVVRQLEGGSDGGRIDVGLVQRELLRNTRDLGT